MPSTPSREALDLHALDQHALDQQALDPQALDQLFRKARTYNAFTGEVDDALLHRLYDLMKFGPTQTNTTPARFVFVRSSLEVKPIYVDFESPSAVSILAKVARRAIEHVGGARLTVSEMLPSLDRAWLPGAGGARYTSELRVIAVDLAQTDPGGALSR